MAQDRYEGDPLNAGWLTLALMTERWRCDDRCSRFDSACTDGFRRLAGATGGLRDIANGVQAQACTLRW